MVVEGAETLRELEISESLFGNHLGTHDVESGEEPAPSARLLVGDALRGRFVAEVEVGVCRVDGFSGYGIDAVGSECIAECHVLAGQCIFFGDALHHVGGKGLCGSRKRRSEQESENDLLHAIFLSFVFLG